MQIKQCERNVVFGWAGVCGEGWKTSSPKNACVGDYVSKKPIKKFEALFVHACQVWDV